MPSQKTMDTKASLEVLVTDAVPYQCSDKIEKSIAAMEAEDVVHMSAMEAEDVVVLANGGSSLLVPITPDSNKESVDLLSKSSPLTLVSSTPPTTDFNSQSQNDSYLNKDDDSPCTPREGVFDPFAPGPDKLLLAPQCMKHLEKSRSYVARSLNFNHVMNKDVCTVETEFEDEMLLETVYDTFLEAIISKQAEDILAEISTLDLSTNELKTPPSAPPLTGIADTCPGAPLKPARKSRNIDLTLCRKLEFEFQG